MAERAPTVAQLMERLRDWPDETLVYVLDKEGVEDRILYPFGVYDYPNDPHRCVIAAYSYDDAGEHDDEEGDG